MDFWHNYILQLNGKTSFWEVNSSSASQEIPRILRNSELNYRFHKSPPPVPILSHKEDFKLLNHLLIQLYPESYHMARVRNLSYVRQV
jgi:hypothetical protein